MCREVSRRKCDKVLEHKRVTDEHFPGKGQGALHTPVRKLSAVAVPCTSVPHHRNLEGWSTKDRWTEWKQSLFCFFRTTLNIPVCQLLL